MVFTALYQHGRKLSLQPAIVIGGGTMKRKYKILILLSVLLLTISFTAIPAFALTESEVQNQVNAVGKEAVTGNIFVWFLCAIAFLKVSQKLTAL